MYVPQTTAGGGLGGLLGKGLSCSKNFPGFFKGTVSQESDRSHVIYIIIVKSYKAADLTLKI